MPCWGFTHKQHWSREVFLVFYIRACYCADFQSLGCSDAAFIPFSFHAAPALFIDIFIIWWHDGTLLERLFPPSFALRVSGIVRALCKFTTNVQPVSAPLLHITMATACCITPNRKVSPVRLRGNHVSLTPFPFFPAVLLCPSISASLSPLAFMVFLHLCVISPFSAL